MKRLLICLLVFILLTGCSNSQMLENTSETTVKLEENKKESEIETSVESAIEIETTTINNVEETETIVDETNNGLSAELQAIVDEFSKHNADWARQHLEDYKKLNDAGYIIAYEMGESDANNYVHGVFVGVKTIDEYREWLANQYRQDELGNLIPKSRTGGSSKVSDFDYDVYGAWATQVRKAGLEAYKRNKQDIANSHCKFDSATGHYYNDLGTGEYSVRDGFYVPTETNYMQYKGTIYLKELDREYKQAEEVVFLKNNPNCRIEKVGAGSKEYSRGSFTSGGKPAWICRDRNYVSVSILGETLYPQVFTTEEDCRPYCGGTLLACKGWENTPVTADRDESAYKWYLDCCKQWGKTTLYAVDMGEYPPKN